jgi:hypothetical protein
MKAAVGFIAVFRFKEPNSLFSDFVVTWKHLSREDRRESRRCPTTGSLTCPFCVNTLQCIPKRSFSLVRARHEALKIRRAGLSSVGTIGSVLRGRNL